VVERVPDSGGVPWREWGLRSAALLALTAAGTAGVVVFGPFGEGARLRVFVDALTTEGLLAIVVGALLAGGRPFVAVRAVFRGTPTGSQDPSESLTRPRRRAVGILLAVSGGALFGGGALVWGLLSEAK
jgi:hypothetical protein